MWKKVKLKEVCKIVNGGTPKSNVREYWEGEIQWLTPKDMGKLKSKYVNATERQITVEGLDNSSAKVVPENSLILSCRAPIGHVFINSIEMSFNQGCKALLPSAELDIDYLYYFVYSSKQLLNDLGTGTTFKEISSKTLGNVEIFLPPLAEQQHIVDKLDSAFAEINKAINVTSRSIVQAKDGLSNLIDEKTSNRSEWKEYKISDLGLVQTGNTPKTSDKANYGTDIPFVKPPHFRANGTIDIIEDGLSLIGAKASRKAAANSVMMVCIGATIGKVAVSNEDVCFNQQINALTTTKDYDAELIYWQMRGSRFQREVREKAGQATLPIISKAKWASLNIFLPSNIEEQIQIRNQLRALSNQTDNYCTVKSKKIQQLESLKSAILAQELQPNECEAA